MGTRRVLPTMNGTSEDEKDYIIKKSLKKKKKEKSYGGAFSEGRLLKEHVIGKVESRDCGPLVRFARLYLSL